MTSVHIVQVAKHWPMFDDQRLAVVGAVQRDLWGLWHDADGSWDGTAYILLYQAGEVGRSKEKMAHVREQGEAIVETVGGGTAVVVTMADDIANLEDVRPFIVAQVTLADSSAAEAVPPSS